MGPPFAKGLVQQRDGLLAVKVTCKAGGSVISVMTR